MDEKRVIMVGDIMKITLISIFGALVLSSCNRGVLVEENSIELIFSEQMLEAAKVELFRGNEKRSEVAETALDKTEPNRSSRASAIFKSIIDIDSVLIDFMHEVNALKMSMFKNKTLLNQVRKQARDYSDFSPKYFDIANKKIYFPIDRME